MAETPLMKQYRQIKSENKDNILFFRLGDFYEMFFEDAVIVSKELGLTLTSRNKEKGIDIPMAGVPFHSAASYISKLVNKGYKVAICEQVENPKQAKGIVKREVVKIITPGTVIDIDFLDEKNNNYLLSLIIKENRAGISYLDITTGEFKTFEIEKTKVLNEVYKISPKEILIEEESYKEIRDEIDKFLEINDINYTIINKLKTSEELIKEYFNIVSLESFGIEDKLLSIDASGIILKYALELHKYNELPITKLSYENRAEYMELNVATQKNLELFSSEKNNIGTLVWVLDECKTAMGSRLLKKFIKNPLTSIEKIKKRQNDVTFFIKDIIKREEIKENLKNIYDIERLIGKIILGTENGRDLIALKKSIKSSIEIAAILNNDKIIKIDIKKLDYLYKLIDTTITEEPPFSIREGGIIKENVNLELDELRKISKNAKDIIIEIEAREREKTGIKTMKIKYNKIFGYFLEVTKSNINLVPDTYIRKQTLTNAERYITEELKEIENKIINAKDKIENLEYELFKEISEKIRKEKNLLQQLANDISYLDVIISLASVAIKNDYIKPELNTEYSIEIKEGRHPIVEKLLIDEDFIANDVYFDREKNLIILTGPNMAGKSTYMKQVALILILAQMGSYVPADYATIGIVDKIFTRIGASDDLVSGQSTFMVEMSEVANIMNNATENSFIILDEVGRGTSTFDGISIATSITEYIHNNVKAKTIFATHYHELTELENRYKTVINYRIEVKEIDDSVIFLRKIVKGGADKSYGIEVARLAGLPNEILENSRKILKNLEEKRALIEKKIKGKQLALFGGVEEEIEDEPERIVEIKEVVPENIIEIIKYIETIDINNITPMQAINYLNEIVLKLKNK
ncbi:DNA mismatch repair protein MutS [Hypnocyclicus thermotrophus]|uniref:DNA mismatch repair protein MutS n=1 Tax=Hypnocyclicus thermotrophus TaxID=1627895 RepID=A0AA46DYF3_9FUSO|nr:DNA mismatch repair protein MutS [Hypnocyclicus thermotrophus]TDT69220.1 DNA mismatch repair protein MutS [Hypnocyclicus thermotrophus]